MIALHNSYDLLNKLSDPLGQLYQQNKEKISNALEKRNNSLFAHGFQPITRDHYQIMENIVIKFIKDGINLVIPPKLKFNALQFPTNIPCH